LLEVEFLLAALELVIRVAASGTVAIKPSV
jgi:hypothetical protein